MKLELKAPCLLVASPELLDPNFQRAVVLLCQHSDEGSLGFILNRPLDVMVGQLIEGAPQYGALGDQKAFLGGPVGVNTATVLFVAEGEQEGASRVKDGLHLTGSTPTLQRLFRPDIAPPPHRFVMGYAGWGGGQLAGEIRQNAWFVLELDVADAFSTPPEMLWDRALSRLGIESKNLVIPEDSSLN